MKFAYGLLIIVSFIMIFMLFAISSAMAAPINYHEWLIEYENVEVYPAPIVETVILPYPEPTREVIVKKKPKVTATEESTVIFHEENRCILEKTNAWLEQYHLDSAYFFTNTLGFNVYCFGNPPDPTFDQPLPEGEN